MLRYVEEISKAAKLHDGAAVADGTLVGGWDRLEWDLTPALEEEIARAGTMFDALSNSAQLDILNSGPAAARVLA